MERRMAQSTEIEGATEAMLGKLRRSGRPVLWWPLSPPPPMVNFRDQGQAVALKRKGIFLVDAALAKRTTLGPPRAQFDDARLVDCARIARLDSFIQDLPEGYETSVGERNVRLSGGQRQRVGIAQALHCGSDLIVFEKATSALDDITEPDAIEAIEALPAEKTILMIASSLTIRRDLGPKQGDRALSWSSSR